MPEPAPSPALRQMAEIEESLLTCGQRHLNQAKMMLWEKWRRKGSNHFKAYMCYSQRGGERKREKKNKQSLVLSIVLESQLFFFLAQTTSSKINGSQRLWCKNPQHLSTNSFSLFQESRIWRGKKGANLLN